MKSESLLCAVPAAAAVVIAIKCYIRSHSFIAANRAVIYPRAFAKLRRITLLFNQMSKELCTVQQHGFLTGAAATCHHCRGCTQHVRRHLLQACRRLQREQEGERIEGPSFQMHQRARPQHHTLATQQAR